jgi:ATP synthase subunit 6
VINLFNPIDQFLVLGKCTNFTNYIFAIAFVVGVFLYSVYFLSNYVPLSRVEAVSSSLRSVSSDAIISTQGYTAYLIVLFLVILTSNMLGMIPYTLTVTSFALTTFTLSLTSFLGLNLVALTLHRSKLVDLFLPSGAPLVMSWFLIILETISYFVRVLSLAIRLFANMMAGHALTKILGSFAWTMFGLGIVGVVGFAPWLILFAISFLELLICALQAYVFVTLVSLYINDIMHMH